MIASERKLINFQEKSLVNDIKFYFICMIHAFMISTKVIKVDGD